MKNRLRISLVPYRKVGSGHTACLGLTCLLGSSITFAQALPTTPEGNEELDRVLNLSQQAMASRRVQALDEAPSDVTVLTCSDLQALGYRTLGDALGGVMGFTVASDRAYQNVGIRGLYVLGDQNTRVLVEVDGHTINSPAEIGSSKFGEDLGIPLEIVDHIEIIRGPVSCMYGSNAFLGMVRVVTKAAGSQGSRQVSAAMTVGSGGLGELWGQVNGTKNAWHWSLLATGFRRTGFETRFQELRSETMPADLDREERNSAYLRVHRKDWSFAFYSTKRKQYVPQAPYGAAIGNPDTYYFNRNLFAELKGEPVFGNVKTLLRVFGDRNEFQDHFRFDGTRIITPYREQEDKAPDRSLGLELQTQWSLGTEWLFTAGGEQRWHRLIFQDRVDTQTIEGEAKYQVQNGYLQTDWVPSAAFSLVAGLQYASTNFQKVRSGRYGNTPIEIPPMFHHQITPRVALLWLPTRTDSVKLLYAGGFRNPTIFEGYPLDDQQDLKANPDLKPETIRTASLIWMKDLSRGWTIQMGYNDMRWERLIRAVEINSILQQYQNSPESIQGKALEFEVKYHRENLDLKAFWAFYRWCQGEKRLDNSAPQQGGAQAVYRHANWSFAGEIRHLGPQEVTSYLPGRVESRTVLRTSLRRNASWGWLQFTVEDLGNQRPWQNVATEYDPVQHLQEDGRTWRLTLGLRLGH